MVPISWVLLHTPFPTCTEVSSAFIQRVSVFAIDDAIIDDIPLCNDVFALSPPFHCSLFVCLQARSLSVTMATLISSTRQEQTTRKFQRVLIHPVLSYPHFFQLRVPQPTACRHVLVPRSRSWHHPSQRLHGAGCALLCAGRCKSLGLLRLVRSLLVSESGIANRALVHGMCMHAA
jgi:hypothetical protein